MVVKMPGIRPEALQRYAPWLTLALWYVALCSLTRLVLWWKFGRAAQVGAGALLWIAPAGLVADAVQCLYMLAPFALFLWLCPDRWQRSRVMRGVLLTGAALWMFGMLFTAVTEYYFFEEFDSRFNLVSVDYLIYPTEVAGDMWVAYPVGRVIIAGAALACVMAWRLREPLTRGTRVVARFPARTPLLLLLAGALTLATSAFSTNSLGWSANRVANELAANGPSSFFRALRTSEIDYHALYATRDPAANHALLIKELARGGGSWMHPDTQRLERSFPARPAGLGKLNVILVSSESFGAEFSRLYGSGNDWTPEFDRYAQQSLWFRHTYASGTRTVRGLEAITISMPPIPTESVVRRPGNENIATLGAVLRRHGYHTSFLYGGYGYFDNMNSFFSDNGYEVRDRGDLKGTPRFANIWGVADEDLFDMTLAHADELAATGQPFFIHVMTTSNHKPFTFRTGLESFGIKPSGGGRESGVRYADYAQGYFLREAARHGWFSRTIFIIVADHGARVYGRQEIPLRTYEIPLLFYSPGNLAPRRVDSLMTQIDIAPTLLGLLGLPYTAPWFGQDALHAPEDGRVAFFSHNHDVAMLRDGELSILGLQKHVLNRRYDAQTDRYDDRVPVDAALNDLTIAYYQTAYELFESHQYDLPAP
ncbi:MAG: LTA synthase family protein [Proteobacteria bacterium]|nr:LTA synthase family protein [Pseudomonadota bacterium]